MPWSLHGLGMGEISGGDLGIQESVMMRSNTIVITLPCSRKPQFKGLAPMPKQYWQYAVGVMATALSIVGFNVLSARASEPVTFTLVNSTKGALGPGAGVGRGELIESSVHVCSGGTYEYSGKK
jgi:hypothetical protein